MFVTTHDDGRKTFTLDSLALGLGICGALLGAAGCMTEPDETELDGADTAATTAAVQVCREVQHFAYSYNGSSFNWDVTTEAGTGRQFVDERRIGGGFYRQYRVSPVWSYCPHANESVTLISSAATLTGSHNCLPDGRQEYHGSDYQRLLVKRSPFLTYNCDP